MTSLAEYRGLGPPLPKAADGARADRYLAAAFPFHSRNEWRARCENGDVLRNGRPLKASGRLAMGDQLVVHHPLEKEPEVDTGIAVLGERSGLLAVHKPGNLPMHISGDFRRRTLEALLAERFGPEWAPVHRLDRETSGVVLCAATAALRHDLAVQFFERRVTKVYQAVLIGAAAFDALDVDQPIAADPRPGRPRYLVAPHGSAAVTGFRVTGRALEATRVEVRPKTGKTNQIRVHAAWAGHPLVGDKLYHPDPAVYEAYHAFGDGPEARALAGFPRHALHAAALTVRHPGDGAPFAVESPWPSDLAALWAALGGAP